MLDLCTFPFDCIVAIHNWTYVAPLANNAICIGLEVLSTGAPVIMRMRQLYIFHISTTLLQNTEIWFRLIVLKSCHV